MIYFQCILNLSVIMKNKFLPKQKYLSQKKSTTIVIQKKTDYYYINTENPSNWHLVANCSIERNKLLENHDFSFLVDVHDLEFIDVVLEETKEKKRLYTSVYAVPKNDSCIPDTLEIPWCFMNHSCKPNTFDQWNNSNVSEFKANTNISKGEELTYDYNKEQYNYKSPFECQCGNNSCYGTIYGFSGLPSEEQINVLSEVSPFVRAKYNSVKRIDNQLYKK